MAVKQVIVLRKDLNMRNGTMILVTHDIAEAVYLGEDIYIMGRNPGNIRQRISTPFPLHRTRDLKRSPEFNKMVYDLEDLMVNM